MRISADGEERRGKQSAISQKQEHFTAKDAEPPQQAKTGLAGGSGDAKEKE
jgi:hypothetical protein